jgi:hypothetical protein
VIAGDFKLGKEVLGVVWVGESFGGGFITGDVLHTEGVF